MISKKVSEVFHLNQGHQITEEEIYNSVGDTPILTGNNEIVGYVDKNISDKPLVDEEDLPVISYPTKGKVGNFYLQTELFEANNTAVLIPKKEWREKLNLYWVVSYLSPKTKKAYNSKKGIGYISKNIMKEINIEIPNKKRQDRIGELYKKISRKLSKINELLSAIKCVRNETKLNINNGKILTIDDIFNFKSGKGITQDVIYKNKPLNEEDSVPIYSGATQEENMLGSISKKRNNNIDGFKLFNAPAILVTRKGAHAGTTIYLSEGSFTTNDDVYTLKVNDRWKNKLDLKWFSYQHQELFKRIVTSKTDNATFNKRYAKKQKVTIPPLSVQERVSNELDKLDQLITKLKKLKKEMENLSDDLIV